VRGLLSGKQTEGVIVDMNLRHVVLLTDEARAAAAASADVVPERLFVPNSMFMNEGFVVFEHDPRDFARDGAPPLLQPVAVRMASFARMEDAVPPPLPPPPRYAQLQQLPPPPAAEDWRMAAAAAQPPPPPPPETRYAHHAPAAAAPPPPPTAAVARKRYECDTAAAAAATAAHRHQL